MILKKYKECSLATKASLWFLACSFLQKGISVITTPIFTRLLNTSEYGCYNVFNSWLSILSVLITLNMSHGMYLQGLVKFEDEKAKFSSSLQGLTLTLVSLWTIVYFVGMNFWNNLFSLSTVQMLAMLVLIWTSSVYSFWATEQRVELKYKILVVFTLLSSIFKPIISIFLIYNMNDKATARILGLMVVELGFFSWMFVYQLKKGKSFFIKKYWKYALGFCIPLVPHYLSQTVLSSADKIMIERFDSVDNAGIYGLAYSISQLMSIFNVALLGTIDPWIYKNIKEKNIKDIVNRSYVVFIVVAVVNIGLIAVAPEAVKIFAPDTYFEAIWVVPPVAMSVFLQFMYSIFSDFEFYYEKKKYIVIATFGAAVANIILNYIFIPKFGYIIAGYTTLICYLIYTLFHYIVMKKIVTKYMKTKENFNSKIILVITLIFIAIGFVVQIFYTNIMIRYIIILIICFVAFIKRNLLISLIKKK